MASCQKVIVAGLQIAFLISLLSCSSGNKDTATGGGNADGGNTGTGSGGGTTSDTTAPTVGGSGIVTATVISASQINLSWAAGSDNATATASLNYEICQSTAVAGCNTFTTTYTNAAGAVTRNVTGLSGSTQYFFVVRIKDAAGNSALYTQATGTTTAPVAPTVTNVVVNSTNPSNGIIPFNTGTSSVTITGTSFTGATCPAGVVLSDLAATAPTSCTVDSDTQITATFPAGIRTNGATGWDVKVTAPGGQNTTSAVKFIPKAGLLISEVLLGTTTSASNEFVEIYNATNNSIDLSTIIAGGIRIRRRTAAGTDNAMTLTITNGTIISHGFFLACSSVATAETWWPKCDATFTAGIAANNMLHINLSSSVGLTKTLDLVGFGTITDVNPGGGCEGGNANCANLAANDNSIERKPAGGAGHATDSDVNSADFNGQSTSITPRGTTDPAQP